MSNVRLKNIDRFIDRHGKPRHYYRAGKGARVKLPGQPGSREFLVAYEAALRDEGSNTDKPSPNAKRDASIGTSSPEGERNGFARLAAVDSAGPKDHP